MGEKIWKNPWANFHLYNQYRRSYDELRKKELGNKEKERKLYIIDYSKRYSKKGAFMDLEIETYEDEEVIVHPAYTSFKVEDWINGFPPKIKRA